MASTIEKHVGSRLAHARAAKGYSTSELASLLSVSKPHIEEMEAGEAGLSLRLVAEAAGVLDVPPSFFLEGFQADIMDNTETARHRSEISAIAARIGERRVPLLLKLSQALEESPGL
ncbi:helix-turn-helix transcriptional regulator [Parvibaculaceae bacterium PLY_AMNH_Bact1]|nr:helix-turn-helix transcriptional regulator [Parvibaculaceae bacterium PLY_AMNH_Bact1]